MEQASNFYQGDREGGPSMKKRDDSTELQEQGKDPDLEILIRRGFEANVNKGIELLFRYYYRTLCSHAVRYVSSKEIAEDIVSDIFYKFHLDQTYLEIHSSYRAYLFTSVRHRAFDYVRNELKRNTSMQFAELVAIQPDQQPDHITQYEDLCNDVENAVNSLPLKRRRIYVMHRFEGKKYQEIATELDLSLRTVEAQMYQALHQVRRIIQKKWFLLFLAFLR